MLEMNPIVSGKRVRKTVDRESIDDIINVHKRRSLPSRPVNHSIPAPPIPRVDYNSRSSTKDTRPPVTAISSIVTLSTLDRAPQLRLFDDSLGCSGCSGGYRMVRATNGVHGGTYYYEIEILKPSSENSHIRLGWSTRQGDLQAPVGYDKYSFAYRDVNGSKVHDSIRDDLYGEAFSEGDIVGCSIKLDDYDPLNNEIRFFKNGKDQGVAYNGKEIPNVIYFPAISLYMKANVRVNFGPSFIIKPDLQGFLPVSEVQPMSLEDRKIHEQRIADIKAERANIHETVENNENDSNS